MASNLHYLQWVGLSLLTPVVTELADSGNLSRQLCHWGEVLMNKFLCSMFVFLAIAIASSSAQTGNQGGNANRNQLPQSTQSSQTSASTPSGTAGSNQPNKPSAGAPAGGASTGGAGSAAGNIQVPETPQTPSAATAPSDSDLQAQVQNALSKEPTLSGDAVNVAVSGDSIDITGSVATTREKQTATRIVQSYAGNKKVLSHLTITGRIRGVSPTTGPPRQSREENGTGTGDVTVHPDPNKGASPAIASRPPG